MINQQKLSSVARSSSFGFTHVDLKTPKYKQTSPFPNHRESPLNKSPRLYSKNKDNAFADCFSDQVYNLHVKKKPSLVKDLSARAAQCHSANRREGTSADGQRRFEGPTTPERPHSSFGTTSSSKKSFSSKWVDAEKWVVSSSWNESPAQVMRAQEAPKISRQKENFQQKVDIFQERYGATGEKVSGYGASFNGCLSLESPYPASHGVSSEVFLKDKFMDHEEAILPLSTEPAKEGFLFRNCCSKTMKNVATEVVVDVQLRDFGTEMSPAGSLTASRCHTPLSSSSPVRHNTPADRPELLLSSNPRVAFSEPENQYAHFQLGMQPESVLPNWVSREEEDEEISKSLCHFEMGNRKKTIRQSIGSTWEDEEKTKCCIRLQREQAKIQAWVNLQSAKAEAESRKLEVKIQKMRSKLEEKLLTRMANVHKRAEEWRASAQLLHSQQLQRASKQAQMMKNKQNFYSLDCNSCGCFSCNNHI